jgi:NAD(P)-dependent dehydrogenase (short-subunit alcohol dehydrogenase family)
VCNESTQIHNRSCDLYPDLYLQIPTENHPRGARLILAVGNMEKGINAAKDIVETTGNNNLVVRKLDLASIEEVRKFAQQVNDAEEKLDILILNGNTG